MASPIRESGALGDLRGTMLRTIFCLIAFLSLSGTVEAQFNCDARDPNAAATLAKLLSDYENNLRELGLPQDTYERLLRQGKEQLIKKHDTMRRIDDSCDRQRKESQEREVLEKNLRDQQTRQSTDDVSCRGAVSSVPITPDEVRVIDGDTIRLHHQKPDVRLVGFNAPETRRALCKAERELGGKATRRLRNLVKSSKLDFEFVPCACPAGKERTPYCNYGRRCGTLKANGQDVGLILIHENLAVPFVCGQTRCPPTPKPWCR